MGALGLPGTVLIVWGTYPPDPLRCVCVGCLVGLWCWWCSGALLPRANGAVGVQTVVGEVELLGKAGGERSLWGHSGSQGTVLSCWQLGARTPHVAARMSRSHQW